MWEKDKLSEMLGKFTKRANQTIEIRNHNPALLLQAVKVSSFSMLIMCILILQYYSVNFFRSSRSLLNSSEFSRSLEVSGSLLADILTM